MKRSGIPPPRTFAQRASPPPALTELRDSSMNVRGAMAPPTVKHKPSGCNVPAASALARPLTIPVPEPASKIRKTLQEKAGEPTVPRPAAHSSLRIPASELKSIAGRGHATSISRMPSKGLIRNPSTANLGGSVGAGPRPLPRPKSAYGQYSSHVRSKSHHQSSRPGTALRHGSDEAVSEETERKGVQAFSPISANPSHRRLHVSKRAASSPSVQLPCTPLAKEPTQTDREDLATGFAALSLRASARSGTDRGGREAMPDKEAKNLIRPKQLLSYLPQPTPTPIHTPIRQQPPEPIFRPPASTPRRLAQAPFLSRFTNDRCPDFYNERIEAMERDFRMFKEKMEGDIGQATDYKESLQQLQGRGEYRQHDLTREEVRH